MGIVNFDDRPCLKLLAIITRIDEDGHVFAKYMRRGFYCDKEMMIDGNFSPVEDFGVSLWLDDYEQGILRARKGGPTRVKYPNGDVREWQERIYDPLSFIVLSDWALKMLVDENK